MKRIILIGLMLLIISIGAVSAAENTTQDTVTDANTDSIQTQEKENLDIELEFAEYVLKEEGDVATPISFANVPADYNQSVEVTIDGENNITIACTDYDYKDLEVRSLDYGKHTIHATFPETDKYNGLTLTRTFEITQGYITIPKETDGEDYVSLIMMKDATGRLTVKVDGKVYQRDELECKGDCAAVHIKLDTLSAGTHQIEATYSGDGNYKKITKKATVKVHPNIYISILVPEPNIFTEGAPANSYGCKLNKLEICISEKRQKDPVVRIDGVKYKARPKNDNKNIFHVDMTSLKPGMHKINVTYPGDSNFPKKTILLDYEVTCNISLNTRWTFERNIEYDTDSVYLKLPNDAKGNLNVYIDNTLIGSKPVKNGIASILLTGLNLGTCGLSANYTGDDYDVGNFSRSVKVIPKVTCPKTMVEGENKFLYITADKGINATFTAKLNGKQYNVPVINGKGKFSLSFIKHAEFGQEICISYKNETYSYEEYYTVKVNVAVKFSNGADITMYYGDSRTYSVKITCKDGGKAKNCYVKIKIGSKTSTVKTDSNGVARISIKSTPGKYVITTSYQGSQTTNRLVVKEILTLKGATVKKSAKSLNLQATLKNKSPMKNKQVTFKFNGKTYKAKTNSKGVAKVTIPKSALSKLTVGKTVTYQATYLKDTVKKTVKIQK